MNILKIDVSDKKVTGVGIKFKSQPTARANCLYNVGISTIPQGKVTIWDALTFLFIFSWLPLTFSKFVKSTLKKVTKVLSIRVNVCTVEKGCYSLPYNCLITLLLA